MPTESEQLKTIRDIISSLLKSKQEPPQQQSRSGPLQIAGRMVLGLAAIVALAASVSGYFDWRIGRSEVHWSTCCLRLTLVVLIGFCVVGITALIYFLTKRHPTLLSSPTELDARVHQQLMDVTKGKDYITAIEEPETELEEATPKPRKGAE